jgi:hypothetical protein
MHARLGAHMCGGFKGSTQHLGRDLSRWRCLTERLSGSERSDLWDRGAYGVPWRLLLLVSNELFVAAPRSVRGVANALPRYSIYQVEQ